METFFMSRIDDHEIDCYHQYIAQTNYRLERPEDGDGMMLESRGVLDKPQQIYSPVPVCPFSISHRASARHHRSLLHRMNNARNGLHTPQELSKCMPLITSQNPPLRTRSDCGDFYQSLSEFDNNYQQLSPMAIRDQYYLKY